MPNGVRPLDFVRRDLGNDYGPWPQEQNPGASLSKTGLLGIGVEPGFCAKGLLVDRPSVLTELKVTERQKVRLKQAMIESDRLAQRSGRESGCDPSQLVARGDREVLAEFDQCIRGWCCTL